MISTLGHETINTPLYVQLDMTQCHIMTEMLCRYTLVGEPIMGGKATKVSAVCHAMSTCRQTTTSESWALLIEDTFQTYFCVRWTGRRRPFVHCRLTAAASLLQMLRLAAFAPAVPSGVDYNLRVYFIEDTPDALEVRTVCSPASFSETETSTLGDTVGVFPDSSELLRITAKPSDRFTSFSLARSACQRSGGGTCDAICQQVSDDLSLSRLVLST